MKTNLQRSLPVGLMGVVSLMGIMWMGMEEASGALIGQWNLNEGSGTTVSAQLGGVNGTFNTGASITWQSDAPPWTNLGTQIVAPSYSLRFGGSITDFIRFNDSSVLEPSNMTISFWAKAYDTTTTGERIILSKHSNLSGESGSSWEFGLQDKLYFRVWTTGGQEVRAGNNASDPFSRTEFFDGKWHHFVGAVDSSSVKLYVDGKLIESVSASGGVKATDAPVYMGRRPYTGAEYPYRDIIGGPLLIYDTALSAAEITQMRQAYVRFDLNEGSGTITSSNVGGIVGQFQGNVSWQSGGPPPTYLGGQVIAPSYHLTFPGTKNDYVDLGTHSMMQPEEAITVAFWARTTFDNTGKTLLGKYSAVPGVFEVAFTAGAPGKLNFRFWTSTMGGDGYRVGTNASDPFTSDEFKNGQWHFIAGTYNGAQACLYVDGQLIESIVATGLLKQTTAPLNLGRRSYYGAEEPYKGDLGGPLLIFNYALTQDQIRYLMGIPEPTSMCLLSVGLISLGLVRVLFGRQVSRPKT